MREPKLIAHLSCQVSINGGAINPLTLQLKLGLGLECSQRICFSASRKKSAEAVRLDKAS